MEQSNHKNYIKWVDRNWPLLVKKQILPNEKKIFDLFSQKFAKDAEADLNRWRKKLRELWNLCANSCHEIHEILAWEVENHPELKELVKNIVNLDYESLWEVFSKIQLEYFNTWWDEQVQKHLQNIQNYIKKMRQISKKHTNVISKSE